MKQVQLRSGHELKAIGLLYRLALDLAIVLSEVHSLPSDYYTHAVAPISNNSSKSPFFNTDTEFVQAYIHWLKTESKLLEMHAYELKPLFNVSIRNDLQDLIGHDSGTNSHYVCVLQGNELCKLLGVPQGGQHVGVLLNKAVSFLLIFWTMLCVICLLTSCTSSTAPFFSLTGKSFILLMSFHHQTQPGTN